MHKYKLRVRPMLRGEFVLAIRTTGVRSPLETSANKTHTEIKQVIYNIKM